MNEEWIEQMRQKMADYQWPAPELSWDELDQALTANHPPKTRLLWLRRIAAAAVILLIAGVGYWGFLKNHGDWHNDSSERLRERLRVGASAGMGDGNREALATDRDARTSGMSKTRVTVPVILARSSQRSTISKDPILKSDTITPVSTAIPDTVNATVPDEKEQLPTAEKKVMPVDKTPSVIYPADLHQQRHLNNRLTAKVYMSGTMTSSQIVSFPSSQRIVHLEDTMQTSQIDQSVRHRQPVRLGLLLRYRLDDRWSIESGLIYTRLLSDITTKEDGVSTMTEHRLNYLGFPLNFSYELWKNRHFGLYGTAGTTIEKRLDASTWQFSLNGAIGAEYKLTDFFSLYAEPGLGYYFKDGSTTPTTYQDRPLNFNLSLGLRFNLKQRSKVKVR